MKLEIFSADITSELPIPFADEGVRAGFPSPAQGHMEESIDLNTALVPHPESTFYARVGGDSMIEADLFEGDIIVVDRSLEARDGDMALCVVNNEFTVKYLELHKDYVRLVPANKTYEPLVVSDGDSFEVWGIVTHVIHRTRRKA